MALPSNFRMTSGKNAFMGSLSEWLQTNIPDEHFEFDNPLVPLTLPGYGVTELGLFMPGGIALDGFVGYSGSTPLYAKRNQTLVEIAAWDDLTKHSDANGKVRQMRDKAMYCLQNSGRRNEAGSFIIPPILMYDYYQTPKKEVGYIRLDDSDNSINEKFIVDPSSQNLRAYKLIVRMWWFEYM